ncbi:ferritin heavy chain-like [Dugong dugon]
MAGLGPRWRRSFIHGGLGPGWWVRYWGAWGGVGIGTRLMRLFGPRRDVLGHRPPWVRNVVPAAPAARHRLWSTSACAVAAWPQPPAVATVPSNQVRWKYHQKCENTINRQINGDLHASYVYLSMAYHIDREDLALKNFSAYFLRQSPKEHEHAETLLRIQNQRMGLIQLPDIRRLDLDDWGNRLRTMERAFHLEQSVNQSLLDLNRLATNKGDTQLCDFLERHFLHEQVRAMTELGHHVTNLHKLGALDAGLAEYFFDMFTLGNSDKES